ncbi:hypothetical protein ZOSMA_57G00300 [Zostera marina]|uniref:Transmembrane protein n=1 Tax=Zostera marina TaxID=29655 RepID=A0A0K9NXP3_ZOSMR|nr:hypothetical protein ZOSMA_57G00300 [Zostera marina]
MAGGVREIYRQTVHVFLKYYNTFASIAGLFVFPASASLLISHAIFPSSSQFLNTIQYRFRSLFLAAGFPVTTDFFSLVGLKLSQIIFTFFFTLPFTLTLLLIAKASVISIVCRLQWEPCLSFSLRVYGCLFKTTLCNSMLILAVNAAVFSFLFVVFNTADVFFGSSSTVILILSALGAIVYSIILAHVIVICNLSLVVSAVDNKGGFFPFIKSFFLVRSIPSTALFLAIPANLGLATVEGLFQYRVIKQSYCKNYATNTSLVLESISIIYIHSLLVVLDVLDVIASCLFFNTCTAGIRDKQKANSAASVNQKLQQLV